MYRLVCMLECTVHSVIIAVDVQQPQFFYSHVL